MKNEETSETPNFASKSCIFIANIFKKNADASPNSLKNTIAEIVHENEDNHRELGIEQKEILKNAVNFAEIKVEDVMVPRDDIITIDKSSSLKIIKEVLIEERHTRMPVSDGSLDNIKGFIHIKDIIPFLGSKKKFAISNVIRKILFVPPSMRVSDLLMEMRSSRIHIAIVLDEYGGTDGLVTMEDLMEEIVGEIEDEHDDEEEHNIVTISDKVFEVNARIKIDELENKLTFKLAVDNEFKDVETLGGLISEIANKIPTKGEVITFKNLEFHIKDAGPRFIKKVIVKIL
jgi:CBS domain containing-hemolysin-like protein